MIFPLRVMVLVNIRFCPGGAGGYSFFIEVMLILPLLGSCDNPEF